MEAIINFFTGTLNTVAWLYIFLPCTIVGGLYLTIRNRGIQFTRFGYAMKNTVGKMFQKQEAGAGAVTPLQAVTTALAATVGTGNIVGTSQAIALGGYGAVFWLWLAALLGMMIKYSEVTLSIQYRERDAKGDWVGGPMYYVKNGLSKHWQWVGILFCVFAAIASFGIGNMSQVNSIVGSLNDAIDAFIPAAEGFWLWLAALLGMMIKYSEVTLSIQYRERDAKGDWVGGPMYYVKNGLSKHWQWVGILFCVFAAIASFGIGNMSQVNSIVGSLNDAIDAFIPAAEGERKLLNFVFGVAIAALIGVILFGGIKRIGAVAEKLVPVMSVLYIIFALVVIFGHAGNIGPAFGKIFATAFTPKALGGAASGIALKQTIVWGLRRSAFSNEAGLGSAAIAHAAADTKSPVQQGLYGIFEVFADTIVICTLTALTIICSGVDITFGHKVGSELITAAFSTMFGQKFASVFVALALMLFAFTTILGWSLYGSRCVQYLFGLKVSKIYQVLFIIVVVIGAVASLDVVWDIADTFNGLMAIPNFIALFALSGVVAKLTKEYFFDKDKLKK